MSDRFGCLAFLTYAYLMQGRTQRIQERRHIIGNADAGYFGNALWRELAFGV